MPTAALPRSRLGVLSEGCSLRNPYAGSDQRVSISPDAAKQLIKDDYQVGVETMPAGAQK